MCSGDLFLSDKRNTFWRWISRYSYICYGHQTYSAKSDHYETTPGNGRHADDLEMDNRLSSVHCISEIRNVHTDERMLRLHQCSSLLRYYIGTSLRTHFVPLSSGLLSAPTPLHTMTTLINVGNYVEHAYLPMHSACVSQRYIIIWEFPRNPPLYRNGEESL